MEVILKSRVGATCLTVNIGGKEVKYDFNEKNGYQLPIPTLVKFTDTWGKEIVAYSNLAQHFLNDVRINEPKNELNGESMFELVEVKEEPVVTLPVTKKKFQKEKT